MSSMPSVELVHLGMDTSMNTIVVGVFVARHDHGTTWLPVMGPPGVSRRGD